MPADEADREEQQKKDAYRTEPEADQIGALGPERQLPGAAPTGWPQVTLLPAIESDRCQCLPIETCGPARIEVLVHFQVRRRTRGDRQLARLLPPTHNVC